MNLLKEEKQWNGHSPSPTAIYRFCKANGLKRNPEKMATPVRSFEYPHFGDMWMADFMHGPQVRHKGKDKKAILHAIIDDATRTIVAARFHLSEDTRALISDLMIAVQRFGIPKRFYTDNGSAFRSNHLAHVGAKLSMSLPHTPPYLPQGRGKIERFFRTLRDGFITGRPRTSLDTLNQELEQWIAHYHAREHTSLNMSPLNKRMSVPSVTKVLDNVRNVDALFRMEVHKKVYSDGCIRLHGRLYDVPEALPHQKIKVSYLPWDLSVIYLGEEMLPAKVLDKTKNATRYENPKQGRKS
jgi:putative transposase